MNKNRKQSPNPKATNASQHTSPFQLPPEITVSKQTLSDGFAFVFRHLVIGELGRILVQDHTLGHCHISCEVVGDPDDPMTAMRAEIFEPLGIALSDRIAASNAPVSGTVYATPPPTSPSAPKEVIQTKLCQCERCDAGVALLIFAPGATDPSRFEDYARKMHAEYTRLNLPTWIIGPDIGSGPLMDRPADILQVWPERGEIQRLRPAEFNPRTDKLARTHCCPNQGRPVLYVNTSEVASGNAQLDLSGAMGKQPHIRID